MSIDVASLFSLAGKTAVVTGASSGLGVTFAGALASAGAHVVLAARRADRLEEVRVQIEADGGRASTFVSDVTDPTQVSALMADTAARFGRIDVLVNNAGGIAEAGMMPERIPHEAFLQTLTVNLMGVWHCCREVAPYMLRDGKGGSIINNSSSSAHQGLRDFPPAYQAAKAGVLNLTRNLAASWADRGVRVNAITPGWFPSELTNPVFGLPGFEAWAAKMAPAGRVGRPEELVGALLLLASDAGSFITGHTLAVDGGLTACVASDMPADVYQIFHDNVPHDLGKHITGTD